MTDDAITFDRPEEVIPVPGRTEPVLVVDNLFAATEVWLQPNARAHAGAMVGSGRTFTLALIDAHRTLQGLATECLAALHEHHLPK